VRAAGDRNVARHGGHIVAVAVNIGHLDVPAQRVWALWMDGRRYHEWVVGTSAVRDVDDTFPRPGSAIHYTVGRGPLRHEGHTEVLDVDEGRRLVLRAHAWPLGTADIDLRVSEDGDGRCTVTIDEWPSAGAGAVLHSPVSDGLIRLRNIVTLRRMQRAAATAR
jgi:uncharacterized protein YndB with AHSA1/START domain